MSAIESYLPEMLATRRQLHQYPEIGWSEFRTTERIVKTVRSLGFKTILGRALFNLDYTLGRNEESIRNAANQALRDGMDPDIMNELEDYTGCMAIFDTGREGPVTALRFDIDCVAVEEDKTDANEAWKEGFSSRVNGLMHACGHDAHTAVGLGVAHWIHDHANQLKGKFKLIFQPAEEGTKGAAGIAFSHNLDDVDYIIGAHIGVKARLHEVGIIRNGFLSTTKYNVRFKGVAAHSGSCAQLGRNALMAACNAAVQLMGIPRHGQGNTNVNVGIVNAGEGRNIVAAHADMEMEVRGENADINRFMEETAKRMIAGCATSYGVEHEIEIAGMATSVTSDTWLSDCVEEAAKNTQGVNRVFNIEACPGSEDCSLLMSAVQKHGGQAAFFFYGCNHPGHHLKTFQIQDTESMPVGFSVFVKVLEKLNTI